jgi:RNA polymerase sigma factor (sigma-70 family)
MTPIHSEDSSHESAAELLATLRGSYQVLGQLLHSHRNYLLKIITEEIDSRLIARQGVSDIVQIAFARILENFQRQTEGIFSLATEEDLRRWLRQICLNTLYQEYRDEGRAIRDFHKDEPIQEGFEQEASVLSPSSVISQKEQEDLLVNAINGLPEADRILLRLKDLHNWTYKSLAELLDGQETDAGRVRMQRRLTQLRFELGQNDSLKDLS